MNPMHRIMDAVAVVIGILTYVSLRDISWAPDLAVCIAYSFLVVGRILADRILKNRPSTAIVPIGRLLLTHAAFLATVIAAVRIVVYLKPAEMDWSPHPGGAPINAYLLAVIVIPYALTYFELAMILKESRSVAPAR